MITSKSYDRGLSLLRRLVAAGYEAEGGGDWAVSLRGRESAPSVYLTIHGAYEDEGVAVTVRVSDHAPAMFVDRRGREQAVGGFHAGAGERHEAADLSVHPGSGFTIAQVAAWFAAAVPAERRPQAKPLTPYQQWLRDREEWIRGYAEQRGISVEEATAERDFIDRGNKFWRRLQKDRAAA